MHHNNNKTALDFIASIRKQKALEPYFALPVWACSGGILPTGKPDKSPKDYRKPWKHAKSNDPSTWGTLDQIEDAARRHPQHIHHVGMMSGPHARILDWDHKPHAEQPLIVTTQAAMFAHCYQEISLSGRGLRCLILADDLDFKKDTFELEPGVELEVFASHQYAILTGNVTNPEPVNEAGKELLSLLSILEPKQATPTPRKEMKAVYTGSERAPWEVAGEVWDLSETLERLGYPRKGHMRHLAPTSKTGLAGVTVFRDQQGRMRCYSHHANDPLNNGHANDVFDVYAILEHNGDYKAATREARELLGLRKADSSPVIAPTYSKEEATVLWETHTSDVLEQAGQYLTNLSLHHHAREALINLVAYVYGMAAEGNLSGNRAPFTLAVGGLKQFAALVGGRHTDLKPRLEWLADKGMIGGLRRIDPTNPSSGWVVDLPADPRHLPFLNLTPDPTKTTDRPQTKAVRDGKNPNRDTLPSPRSNTSTANAVGRVNSENTKNPLRALLSLVLCIRRNKNIGLKSISQKLGMRLNTTRKKFAELQELGYLDVSGNLTCTVDQFLADLRAWGAEGARKRLINTLERQREYAVNQLARIVFDEAVRKDKKRFLKMRDRCEDQLQRLYDGEAPHAVIGRAA